MKTKIPKTTGTATSATLTDILTYQLHARYEWVSLKIKNTHPTDVSFADCKLLVNDDGDVADGDWSPLLSGSDWSNVAKLRAGEWSGSDDQGSGHYANDLAAGEFCHVVLFVAGLHAIRIQVSGDGGDSTVEIVGHASGS